MSFVAGQKGRTMADLIDRDVAYSVLEEYYHIRTKIQKMGLREALSRVPDGVVRCKDCKWWNESCRVCESPNWDGESIDYFTIPAGFFCAWGERKES